MPPCNSGCPIYAWSRCVINLTRCLNNAARAKLSYRDLVAFICQREIESKQTGRIARRLHTVRLPMLRELNDCEFTTQPSVHENQFRDLEACRWINHGENVLLVGLPAWAKHNRRC